ncbi:glycoside hydrolase family 2 TIM barrel-domain containing protein, partial [Verrucomicrobiota bacterium]
TAERAAVHVETKVKNAGHRTRLVTLVTTIIDPAGSVVDEAKYVTKVDAGMTNTAGQDFKVSAPQLWSLEATNLYRVNTIVSDEDGEQDTYNTRFGIREIEITPDQGLLLNGEKVFCKGFNIHHDNGCLGAAAFDRAIERRLEVMKELGCNAVRLSHNPHAVKVLDYCDEMGLLVFDEVYDKWDEQFNGGMAGFEDTWPDDVCDWLDRDKNHPSIFIWSAGNEIVKQQFEEEKGYGVPLIRRMVDLIHQHEPTRKVTAALFPAREKGTRFDDESYADADLAEMAFYMDVVSVNYMENFFERDHAKYPQMSFILSEATAGMGSQPWERDKESKNRKGTLPFFAFNHSYTVGLFYWGGIEYIGEAEQWPCKGWRLGFVDLAGWPKPSAHLVRANFSDAPVVYAAITNISEDERIIWNDVQLISAETASHWNWEVGKTVEVTTFSNCESVELILNGRSLGRRVVTKEDCMALTWEVPFEPGTLVTIGHNGETEVDRYELKTAGDACRLQIISDRDCLAADGLDLAHLTVLVRDADGVLVPTAEHQILFAVDGAGTNSGVDNGDLMSNELWQADKRSAYNGRAQLIVRAGRESGNVTVTASAEGVEAATLVLPVQ